MIIQFDPSYQDLCEVSEGVVFESLSEFLRAHRKGFHIGIIRREVAENLVDTLELSTREKEALRALASEFTQSGGLLKRAPFYLKLVGSGDSYWVGNAFHLSLEDSINTSVFERARLLVEDGANDGEIYKYLVNVTHDLYNAPKASMEIVHGGGTRMPQISRECAEQKRVACAIVDTDFDSPSPDKPGCAHVIEATICQYGWPLLFVRWPPAREVENVLSLRVLSELQSVRGTQSLRIHLNVDRQERNVGIVRDKFSHFFDLKEGLTPRKYQLLDPESQEWIKQKLCNEAIDPEICSLEGFGGRIPQQVLEQNNHLSRLRDVVRSREWQAAFGECICELAWLFSATTRSRTL